MYIGPVVSVIYTIDQKACTQGLFMSLYCLCVRMCSWVRDLTWNGLSSCRKRNEYQQFVGQPEMQKYWVLRGIQQQVTAVASHSRRLRVR